MYTCVDIATTKTVLSSFWWDKYTSETKIFMCIILHTVSPPPVQSALFLQCVPSILLLLISPEVEKETHSLTQIFGRPLKLLLKLTIKGEYRWGPVTLRGGKVWDKNLGTVLTSNLRRLNTCNTRCQQSCCYAGGVCVCVCVCVRERERERER